MRMLSSLRASALAPRMYHLRLPGTDAHERCLGGGRDRLAGNPEAVEALKQADMVVDLIFLLFSEQQLEIQRPVLASSRLSSRRRFWPRLMPTASCVSA